MCDMRGRPSHAHSEFILNNGYADLTQKLSHMSLTFRKSMHLFTDTLKGEIRCEGPKNADKPML
jgi:hypothetical protein